MLAICENGNKNISIETIFRFFTKKEAELWDKKLTGNKKKYLEKNWKILEPNWQYSFTSVTEYQLNLFTVVARAYVGFGQRVRFNISLIPFFQIDKTKTNRTGYKKMIEQNIRWDNYNAATPHS